MGLLGLFRGKEEPKPQEPEKPSATVKISGLSAWLGHELSEKGGSAREKSGELQENILKGFNQVGDSARKLEKSGFERGDKTYAAVNSVKDTFARRVQGLSGKCPAPAGSYSGMREFHKRAGDLLREMTGMTPRQGIILSNYFRRESSPVMKGIKDLGSSLEDFKRFLDYEGRPLFILEEAERVSGEIAGKLESLRNLEVREKEIKEKIKEMREGLSRKEGELELVLNDLEWKNLERAKREREALDGRAGDIKFRIREELSSAMRPLKKYLHLKAGELPRDERIFLEGFVKSPLKAVMSGGTGQLRSHLLMLKDMVEAGLNLKEKEMQKLEGLIERIGAGEIDNSIQEHGDLLREAERMGGEAERGLSGLSEGKRQAEDSIKEAKGEIEKLERELEETREKAKSLKEEAGKLKEGLETLIYENINRKVNIVLETNV